ncbi:MAG: DUF5076 domain-containing protein [Pseudomonadota bacterium]|nr:hypothetical protein [Pseudomonadales bacterium]MDY6920276.1 DUF5076 domain-containing protein [Pseudomonadota bacterium]
MTENPKTLPIPPEVQTGDAQELVRVWDVQGKQHVSISNALGGSPRQFGQLLAQIALYSSQIYQQTEKLEPSDCLRQILTGFKEEVAKEVTGSSGS